MMGYVMFWIGFITIFVMVLQWNAARKEEKWERETDVEYENYIYWYNYFNEEVEEN